MFSSISMETSKMAGVWPSISAIFSWNFSGILLSTIWLLERFTLPRLLS